MRKSKKKNNKTRPSLSLQGLIAKENETLNLKGFFERQIQIRKQHKACIVIHKNKVGSKLLEKIYHQW